MSHAPTFGLAPALRRRLLVAALGLLPLLASAQAGNERTIRILTPYEPGSLVDVTTRLVADGLRTELGQPVVVENRTGGMGMVAMNALPPVAWAWSP